jgi:RHS repeat-associated protein
MEFNLRYPGQYFDAESKLHYNYFRSYSASQGRYTQADPIGLDGGMNRFGYVEGEPISNSDNYGLQKLHGNWCGPDFTGGFSKSYDKLDEAEKKAVLPPVDKLDQCCQIHDVVYAACRKKFPCDADARQQCFQEADRQLAQCAVSSGKEYGAHFLLMGNPKSRISSYMISSKPSAEENDASCSCKKPIKPSKK